DGDLVRNDRDAVDLMTLAWSHKAKLLVVPVSRLDPDFFVLRTGVAGEIVQKFVTYRLPLAILGDISAHLAASAALRAFVYEANRGKDMWFVADESELDGRLSSRQPA
ncbi:MAG TPA: DUF4180 domain-containing protein, partial [Pseudonocardiaceae bacterium]